ncbi:MAG: hypothetical protein GWP70_06390 [Proteobacteria bacterium]|nr:hypothetical protein [Pseudomonadota bacterium]
MSEPTFKGLFKDLVIFFGTVLAFVGGFLLVSFVLPPSRNAYGFWLGFLIYMFVFAKLLGWALKPRRKGQHLSD